MPCAKILVVDDHDGFLEFCNLALKDKYEVILAKNGVECEELIRREKPDLVLLDIYLPRGNGLSLTEKFKADKDLCHIPIILITGMVLDKDLPPGFWKMGTSADGFLTKPVDLGTLLNEVEKVLAKAHGIDLSQQKTGGYL